MQSAAPAEHFDRLHIAPCGLLQIGDQLYRDGDCCSVSEFDP